MKLLNFNFFQFLIILQIVTFSLQPTFPNPNTKESQEIYKHSKRICDRTSECFRKETAKLPPEQRKMMESMFPTGNICESRYSSIANNPSVNSNSSGKIDVEAFKKCADDMVKLSCDKIIQGLHPKSCDKFKEK